MLLGKAVAIAVEHPEAVILVIGQRFTSGMIRADLLRERLVPLLQLGSVPEREPCRVGLDDRDDSYRGQHEKSGGGDKPNGSRHGRTPFCLQPRVLQVKICFRLKRMCEQENLRLAEKFAGQVQRRRRRL